MNDNPRNARPFGGSIRRLTPRTLERATTLSDFFYHLFVCFSASNWHLSLGLNLWMRNLSLPCNRRSWSTYDPNTYMGPQNPTHHVRLIRPPLYSSNYLI